MLTRSSLGFQLATTTFKENGFPGYPQRIEQTEFAKRHRWENSESEGITRRLNQILAEVFSQCGAIATKVTTDT